MTKPDHVTRRRTATPTAAQIEETRRFLDRGGSLGMLCNVDANDEERLYGFALTSFEGRDFVLARNVFTVLTVIDQWNVEYWLGLGLSQQELGDHDASLAAFTLAESISLPDPRPRFYAALSFLRAGERDKAMRSFETCLLWCGADPQHRVVRELAAPYLAKLQGGH